MRILIRDLLTQPQQVCNWSENDWDTAVQQGYATGLLARMYSILKKEKLLGSIPLHISWHFNSAYKLYLAHKLDVEEEINNIVKTLSFANIRPTFLKGAGYIIANDVCHHGRLFVDLDIYVDKSEIPVAEQMLHWSGWQGEELDSHDEKYYRDWMHEIPPLTHAIRGMTVDVHHNLIPLTSKLAINGKLLNDSVKSKMLTDPQLVLSSEDRVLHSAMHLLLDGEFQKGFRDLNDIDLLIRDFSAKDSLFWEKLLCRTKALGLGRILYYCLYQTRKLFDTPVPTEVVQKVNRYRPTRFVGWLLNSCFSLVLVPEHVSCQNRYYNVASQILFLRSHWLKMPLHILIPHLCYKALVSPYKEWKKRQELENEKLTG